MQIHMRIRTETHTSEIHFVRNHAEMQMLFHVREKLQNWIQLHMI